MTGSRMRPAIIIAGLLLSLLAVTLQGVQGEELEKVPSEDQCRPYIEKALKDLGTEGSQEQTSAEDAEAANDDNHEGPGEDTAADANETDEKSESREKRDVSAEGGDEAEQDGDNEGNDKSDENEPEQEQVETVEISSAEDDDQDNGSVLVVGDEEAESVADSKEDDGKSKEADAGDSKEAEEAEEPSEGGDSAEAAEEESAVAEDESGEQKDGDETYAQDENEEIQEVTEEADEAPEGDNVEESAEQTAEEEEADAKSGEEDKSAEEETVLDSQEEAEVTAESVEEEAATGDDDDDDDQKEGDSKEEEADKSGEQEEDDKKSVEEEEVVAKEAASVEQEPETAAASEEAKDAEDDGKTEETASEKAKEEVAEKSGEAAGEEKQAEGEAEAEAEEEEDAEGEGEDSRPEEEELIMEIDIPEILRPRDHINQLLKLDEENELKEKAVEKVADVVLRDLKRLYDNAIKPLETLYKYRDLSNRHFGDPEIFSKPLVLFMGPWSGGKSSIINYLLNIEYKPTSLRTGAEPSPAYFNILMHGEEEEVLDGTQLAADWTFSGLQKFGQGLLDRLKGYKLKSKLLEKVNIVEIPGILEIRKQVQRLFPFNDACQWFIDRADIIFLVYDPSKLDVGPETEAILDQLKGREYQTRIILNKADQVKPEELMRVQGALIWNISPLMSSAEPPVMYSASLWSIPYEAGAPTRLLYAQERAFLRDLRSAVDKRVEHKIASARRFAVRVRNHAKMVDCYLTTYYNQKGFFSKKKDISDRIIENPQDYHIYEGLSTLTNISRYDLPDPDVYRDFFRLNPLYEFPLLSSTCTYFRGCPINRLDVAIAYDLPELVGKYKKSVEAALHQEEEITAAPTPAPTPAAQQQAQKPTARSGAGRISMS